MKKKKITEHRSLNSVIKEVFGGDFSPHWFIPYRVGGYLPFFKKLYNKNFKED
jgi:hypothetical protein